MEEVAQLLKSLENKIDSILASSQATGRSLQVNEIAAALATAQQSMDSAVKNRTAGGKGVFQYNYADLEEVVSASRPHLAKNGLSVTQQIIGDAEGRNVLHTLLMHKSGQWIESTVRLFPIGGTTANDVQAWGKCITYMRRYTYGAIVGVTATEDDDAQTYVQTAQKSQTGVKIGRAPQYSEAPVEMISKDQLEELEIELADYPQIAQKILEGLGVQNLADMPKFEYRRSIEFARRTKEIIKTPK